MHEAPVQADPLVRVSLQTLTERMRQGHEGNVGQDPIIVEEIVAAVLDTMHGRLSPNEAMLLREVAGLGRIIEQAKASVAEVSVDAIRGSHIPSATGELDAIVEHTAIATNSILECCEMLDRLAASLNPDQAAVVQGATLRIYEACSFQDITGQRITKIVKALQAIEAKVVELSATYARSDSPDGSVLIAKPVASASAPVSILNGPGLAAEAMDQSDIDKLLADF